MLRAGFLSLPDHADGRIILSTEREMKMNKAVIYARYSSDLQDEGSINAQVRAAEEYAARHGLTIVGKYIDEAISGKGTKTASRTAYQKMLRDASKGAFDTILIHKMDRVARSALEHLTLEAKLEALGVTLISTTQDFGRTIEGKLMRRFMGALSEYFIDNLGAEVKKGHKETALKGLHNGGYPPFGYDVVDQQYIINDLEAGYVRKMFTAAVNREGFTELIAEMEAAGIKGKRGRPIKYPQIYEILRNEKYTGVYLYCQQDGKNQPDRRAKATAIRIENALPIIISKAQFEEVKQIMTTRKQVGRGKAGYLCSGLVYCTCGAKMHGLSPTRGRKIYSCSATCGFGSVRMEDIDAAASQYLRELLSPETQREVALALRKYQTGESDRVAEFNAAVKREIADKQAQYDKLMANLSNAVLPPAVVERTGLEMQSLLDEIAALKETEPPRDFTIPQIETWLESLKTAPDTQAICLLIERIDVIEKTDFKVTSTLKSVLGKLGSGNWI